MRIGIWISHPLNSDGGGASYEQHLIELIDNHTFPKYFDCIFLSTKASDVELYKKPVLFFSSSKPKKKELIYQLLSKILPTSKKFKRLQDAEQQLRFHLSLTKFLKYNSVSIIYYPFQHTRNYLSNTPFIATNWDIGHLTTYSFPEFLEPVTNIFRSNWYNKELNEALLIITESNAGRDELLNFTNVGKHKIRIVPLIPGSCIRKENDPSLLAQHELVTKKFFFYPSQFWAHKNHITLLDAFKIVLNKFPEIKLVLSGSDKGNLDYIIRYCLQSSLQDRVVFPGFVSEQAIATFYRHATALVMPTYLGPTNMPLLEARKLGCPVLCSNLDGHREMMGEGALYFQPNDPDDIASTMKKSLQKKISRELLKKAAEESENSFFTIENSMQCLEQTFIDACNIRKCWPVEYRK